MNKPTNLAPELEQELDQLIPQGDLTLEPDSSLAQDPLRQAALQNAAQKLPELCFIVSEKAYECELLIYGDMVKTCGLVLNYLYQHTEHLSNIIERCLNVGFLFALWTDNHRRSLTGETMEDIIKISMGEITAKKLEDAMKNFSFEELMAFLAVQDAAYFLRKLADKQGDSFETNQQDWIDLVKERQLLTIKVPPNIFQEVIDA